MFDRRRTVAASTVALRRGAWQMSAALFLEVLASTVALVGLVQGRQWWIDLVVLSVVLLLVPAVLRTLGVPAWLASLIDVGVYLAAIQVFFTSGASFADLFQRAIFAIQAQRIPAAPLPELIFFIALFGGAMAVLLDLLAVTLRVPALTAVVLGGVLVVPAVLQPGGLSLIALGACAAAWFVVLEADGRLRFGSRGSGPLALAVGASVTLLAVIVAATAPGFAEVGLPSQSEATALGDTVSPLIDLGKDLRQPNPVNVLMYTTDASTPPYLQLTTLDRIDGSGWAPTRGTVTSTGSGATLDYAYPTEAVSGGSVGQATTQIAIQNLVAAWLPAPYPAIEVDGTSSLVGYRRADQTLVSNSGTLSGRSYTVTSLDLEPTEQQLAALGFPSSYDLAPASADLALPADVPGNIVSTANLIKSQASGTSEIAIATAIQAYFQDSRNGFTYSTATPDAGDGASLQIVSKFLTEREGYCVHFASAMAVIARVLGIPSRVAIGYLPGVAIGSSTGGSTTYSVNSSELHAWPQLYFPKVGWLDFEPTVSRGSAPRYSIDYSTPTVPSQPTVTSSAVPTTAPTSQAPVPTSTPIPTAAVAAPSDAAAPHSAVPTALGVLVLLAIALAPMTARLLRRRARITRLREDGHPVSLAWDEVRDTARDLGFTVSRTETPRGFAARLSGEWRPDVGLQRDLDELLTQLELAEFGPPRHWERFFELADTAERAVHGLQTARPLGARVLALIAPRSLFAPLAERAAGLQRTLT
ncbi:MAG: transglutaminaseTgpA domain-containing protein [Microbacteriaceae bacterium]|nr:transglutaminaseTgpA domain-containing protein [Microbacteriaceae bacterium]